MLLGRFAWSTRARDIPGVHYILSRFVATRRRAQTCNQKNPDAALPEQSSANMCTSNFQDSRRGHIERWFFLPEALQFAPEASMLKTISLSANVSELDFPRPPLCRKHILVGRCGYFLLGAHKCCQRLQTRIEQRARVRPIPMGGLPHLTEQSC